MFLLEVEIRGYVSTPSTIRQAETDRNFIDNKKSQLDLHVMCIHGMQQKTKTKHSQTLMLKLI